MPRTDPRYLDLRDRDLTRMQRFHEQSELYGDLTWVGPTLYSATLQSV